MASLFNIFNQRQRAKKIDRDIFLERFQNYQEILNANREALELMAEQQQKLSGDYLFDRHYLNTTTSKLETNLKKIIQHLNLLSDHGYKDLNAALEKVMERIQKELSKAPVIPKYPFTIPFGGIDKNMRLAVGEKCANLGEAKKRLGFSVPSGFAISTYAFQVFMQQHDLHERINTMLNRLDIKSMKELEEASNHIQALIMETLLPDELAGSIAQAYGDMVKENKGRLPVAVRSSAAKEDGALASFAGQYKSFLNVAGEDIGKYYRLVLASQFSPRAIYYFKNRGFDPNDIPMAVGVMAMVKAAGAGIIYTVSPEEPDKDYLIINAVFGLGISAVGGETKPDMYHVARKGEGEILFRESGQQDMQVDGSWSGGIERQEIPLPKRGQPVLNDAQILRLRSMALALEELFGTPQDIEWAIDQNGTFFILQSRPLRVRSPSSPKDAWIQKRIRKDLTPLVESGTIASTGIGAGPVYIVKSIGDLENFPAGAVLVSHHAPPDYALVVDRASAIVTEVGSLASHMATVAREFMVPALFNVPRATELLAPGTEITVDAINAYIYEGIAHELLNHYKKSELPFKNIEIFNTLKNITKHVTPLNLTDPRARNFAPKHCQTLHDITRFAHEMAMHEMFTLGEKSSFPEGTTKNLKISLPLDIFLVDLGKGIEERKAQSLEVEPADISCRPFLALWNGITQVKWAGPRPVNLRGFMSVVARSASDPGMSEKLAYKNYVIITDRYMNFSTRLGYHFSSIDAFIGESISDNYVQFIFNGGGADLTRRVRRARLITKILNHHGFNTTFTEDNIYARGEHLEAEVIEHMLSVLGIIVVTTRQMDMVMYNDKVVEWYFKEFLKGNYSFGSTINT